MIKKNFRITIDKESDVKITFNKKLSDKEKVVLTKRLKRYIGETFYDMWFPNSILREGLKKILKETLRKNQNPCNEAWFILIHRGKILVN